MTRVSRIPRASGMRSRSRTDLTPVLSASPVAYTIAYSPCAPRPTDPVPRGQLWPLVSVYVCMYI